ncbi:MAG: adenylyl-sulfate kinase, partial [bacterium]|nr:adenylyl-sulfate kinase [bacterium]
MSSSLISPYCGRLLDLVASPDRTLELKELSRNWPSCALRGPQVATVELLLTGGLSPLRGFMGSADAESVSKNLRLKDGTPWGEPIVLEVNEETSAGLAIGDYMALRDGEGAMLAALEVTEVWQDNGDKHYVAGPVEGVELPHHFDFSLLRRTPRELRERFARLGWRRVAAFQTTGVIHRPQYEQAMRAAKDAGANLLIHAESGAFEPDRRDDFTAVRCLQALMPHFPRKTAQLALLPFAFSHSSERDLIMRAIIARNYGCSHVIVNGARRNVDAKRDEIIEQLAPFAKELGVEFVKTTLPLYYSEVDAYLIADEAPKNAEGRCLEMEDVRTSVRNGHRLPDWYTFPEISVELQKAYPPRNRQGFTVFFTGLSGAGKSTLAKALLARLMELGDRPVTLLDGDIVRRNLSAQLGFSREDRDMNIRRIGFVASEITKNRGVALCAPIAPYDSVRRQVRETIEAVGGFILVHVNPPLDVCEQRDRKGLYAKARAGIIKNFTGISDPYEEPADAEINTDT